MIVATPLLFAAFAAACLGQAHAQGVDNELIAIYEELQLADHHIFKKAVSQELFLSGSNVQDMDTAATSRLRRHLSEGGEDDEDKDWCKCEITIVDAKIEETCTLSDGSTKKIPTINQKATAVYTKEKDKNRQCGLTERAFDCDDIKPGQNFNGNAPGEDVTKPVREATIAACEKKCCRLCGSKKKEGGESPSGQSCVHARRLTGEEVRFVVDIERGEDGKMHLADSIEAIIAKMVEISDA